MKRTLFGSLMAAMVAVPVFALAPADSGLKVGEMTSAFEPHHISGPDAGTDTCPVCKYGALPAVQIWAKPDDMANTLKLAKALDARVGNSKHQLKAFVINMSDCDKCIDATKTLAKEAKTSHVGITYIPVKSDAVKSYKINTSSEVKNTVFVYKNMKVVAKFVNLKADDKGLQSLNEAVSKIDK